MNKERVTAIMVDGSNLHASIKALRMEIDYKQFKSVFGEIFKSLYFTAVLPSTETSTIRPMLDWLSFNGWVVVEKDTQSYHNKLTGETKVKGNMDVEIAVHAMLLAPKITHLILFTGDGDFRFLVEILQNQGVHVTVVSTKKTQPSMVSDKLRRQCDEFLDLDDLRDKLGTPRNPMVISSMQRSKWRFG